MDEKEKNSFRDMVVKWPEDLIRARVAFRKTDVKYIQEEIRIMERALARLAIQRGRDQ